ncbi:hypothetical protein [Nocardioides sp.]|uniref:hypothetical protein n=1 Tax=Nocardioides sp. TaxID=35761 RepID=UPI0035672C40
MTQTAQTSTTYRLAGSVATRFVGLSLIALALVMFLGTVTVALADWSPAVLVALLLVGLAAASGFAWWLRSRAWVVRASEEGYQVRLVRGAGQSAARWDGVEDVVTTVRRGVACLEFRLREGGRTTIPVGILAVDKEQFVRDVQERLQTARNLRPYQPPTAGD